MSEHSFPTIILAGETKNVAGIEVPPEIITALGAGQRARVAIDVNGYSYVSTIGKMGGKHLIPLNAEHRKASGLSGGESVEVRLRVARDEPAPALPDELQNALREAGLTEAFTGAAPSKRKEWVRQVVEAKGADTRIRRIHKIIGALRAAN